MVTAVISLFLYLSVSISVVVPLFVVHCSDVIVAGQPREENRIPLCTEGRPRMLDWHVLLPLCLCHALTVNTYRSSPLLFSLCE